jgi:hypothetical protein
LIRKCKHGVYDPDGTGWGCQECRPPEATDPNCPAPILPRSSSDPLVVSRPDGLQICPSCKTLILYSNPGCAECLPLKTVRKMDRANAKQKGSCGLCGSTIHYETKDRAVWECSECGNLFPSSRRRS